MFRFVTKTELVEISRDRAKVIVRTEKTFADIHLADKEVERLAAAARKKVEAEAKRKKAEVPLPPAAQKFLAVLDAADDQGTFPFPLHDRMDYAGMRLHAYRGKAGQALIFEMVVLDRESQRIAGGLGFRNHVFVFSDRKALHVWNDRLLPIKIEPTEDPHTFLLRRKRVRVPKTLKEPRDMLRYLVDRHGGEVFSNDGERAKVMKGMFIFLRVPAWHYRFEKPSQMEVMRELATALAFDEPGAYKPKVKPNTDWRKISRAR